MTQETLLDTSPNQDQTDINALLAIGKKAKTRQYYTLLRRIGKGEVLNITEQKVLNILQNELKAQLDPGRSAASKATFPHIKAVAKYLDEQGWKVSQSTVYSHKEKGKLKPREDGLYHLEDIETYLAESNIHRKNPTEDKSQSDRSTAEARKALAQAIHWEERNKILQNQYVPREAFEQELSARAAMFNADLEEFFYSQAPAIIHLVEGNDAKTPELIDFLITTKETWIARYAEHQEFKIDASAYARLFDNEKPPANPDEDPEGEDDA